MNRELELLLQAFVGETLAIGLLLWLCVAGVATGWATLAIFIGWVLVKCGIGFWCARMEKR